MKQLVIGDIHIKPSTFENVNQLLASIVSIVKSNNIDRIVLLGDVLDYHERVYTQCLNLAYKFIDTLRNLCQVYVIVGNHDYISNSQFLTENHWMNALKLWANVIIVDKVLIDNDNVYCPYVPPGRLYEALSTNAEYTKCKVLFCHQEFRGCDMGCIKSEHGDNTEDISNMLVICGHIHDSQWIGNNIYYVGTPYPVSFGESNNKSIIVIDSNEISKIIPLNIGSKLTIATCLSDVDSISINKDIQTRLVFNGTVSECKAFKKMKQYKELSKQCKIIFRTNNYQVQTICNDIYNFNEILVTSLDNDKEHDDLKQLYLELVS